MDEYNLPVADGQARKEAAKKRMIERVSAFGSLYTGEDSYIQQSNDALKFFQNKLQTDAATAAPIISMMRIIGGEGFVSNIVKMRGLTTEGLTTRIEGEIGRLIQDPRKAGLVNLANYMTIQKDGKRIQDFTKEEQQALFKSSYESMKHYTTVPEVDDTNRNIWGREC